MPQSLPPSAREYAGAQAREINDALAGIRFAWRKMTGDLDASWEHVAPEVQAVMDLGQRRIAYGAQVYIPAVLAETNPAALRLRPDYAFDPGAIVGTSGDGLGTHTLAYEAVIHTKTRIAAGETVAAALDAGGKFLMSSVGTMLSDTGRTVEKVEAVGRHTTTFVRMLVPPSCGRCVILAGRVTHAQVAFQRHPRCDCRNIPARESDAQDMTVNPAEYLGRLDDKGLRKALGSEANARAYKDGADLNQLINAYRKSGAVRSAQMAGGAVKVTTEGVARGAWARRAMTRAGLPARQARLMPESIYQTARSDAEAQNLLRTYGWIL